LTNGIRLTDIHYPVFRLGVTKPEVSGSIIQYVEEVRDEDTETSSYTYRIVDDKSQPGDTLAKRRLHMLKLGIKLKKIQRAVFFLADLIKLASSRTWFIDARGVLFNYKKTKSYPLYFKKITKIIPMKTGGCIVEVQGIANRFKSMYPPIEGQLYAGILKFENTSDILYGFYDEQYDKTRRHI
jgi:hypothetical protein